LPGFVVSILRRPVYIHRQLSRWITSHGNHKCWKPGRWIGW